MIRHVGSQNVPPLLCARFRSNSDTLNISIFGINVGYQNVSHFPCVWLRPSILTPYIFHAVIHILWHPTHIASGPSTHCWFHSHILTPYIFPYSCIYAGYQNVSHLLCVWSRPYILTPYIFHDVIHILWHPTPFHIFLNVCRISECLTSSLHMIASVYSDALHLSCCHPYTLTPYTYRLRAKYALMIPFTYSNTLHISIFLNICRISECLTSSLRMI